jgi:hypothetical protein
MVARELANELIFDARACDVAGRVIRCNKRGPDGLINRLQRVRRATTPNSSTATAGSCASCAPGLAG